MAGPFRALFLFSSFGPLYAILAVKLYYNDGIVIYWPIIFVALSIGAVLVFFCLISCLKSDNGFYKQITDIKSKDTEVFAYLTTYIPQLLTRNLASPSEFVPLMILYGLIALIYFKLDSPYMNPFFILFGYRLYEAKVGNLKVAATIICKGGMLGGAADMVLYEVAAGSIYYCEIGGPSR